MTPYTVVAGVTVALCLLAQPGTGSEHGDRYLQAVRLFADQVLAHGRDTYGPKKTPLFVDGLNVDTLKPPVWKHEGEQWVLSNMATQQNLFRTLDGLTSATGDARYRNAAVDAMRYQFENLRDPSGLLYWGGHYCYDALGDRLVGESRTHEFKRHYPYYELMWDVDPVVTRQFIEALWKAHVLDWGTLDFNRHGKYGGQPGSPWLEHHYTGGRVPFAGKGLTFMMSGTDLVYAAAMLSRLSGEQQAGVWAERLARRYVDARHPATGLGACNFSVHESHRMRNQFPQFGGRFTEATITDIYGARYTYCAMALIRLGETLGEDGRKFLRWGLEELVARAKTGYDEQSNSFWATLIDGTKLSPADRKLDGYVEERWLEKRKADERHFLMYAAAYRITGNDLMWRMARSIGRGIGLGDIGERAATEPRLDPDTAAYDALAIVGLLDLWQATGNAKFLKHAQRVGDNALAKCFHNGFVVPSRNHLISKFDDLLPLALLHLHAASNGLAQAQKPPAFWLSHGYLHCPYDGEGRTYDRSIIYTRLRGQPEP